MRTRRGSDRELVGGKRHGAVEVRDPDPGDSNEVAIETSIDSIVRRMSPQARRDQHEDDDSGRHHSRHHTNPRSRRKPPLYQVLDSAERATIRSKCGPTTLYR